MQILKVSDVRDVTCLGAGPIGAGWAAYFLAKWLQRHQLHS